MDTPQTPHEQAGAALNLLMNVVTNATNLNQSYTTIGATENVLRGFIKANTPQPSPDPEDPIDG